jgi:HPt (histidine-containing phosphotransfer) domain-containing protein
MIGRFTYELIGINGCIDENDSVNSGEQEALMSADEVVFHYEEVLERMDGDTEAVAMVIKLFVRQVALNLDTIRQDLLKCDCAGVRRKAGSLKGAALNVGMHRLASLALQIEDAARAEDLKNVLSLTFEFEYEFCSAVNEARKILPNAWRD